MRIRPPHARRSAATLVETSVVISIALLFIFGIFEYGRFVMTKQLLENAAREGARWASVHTYDGTTAGVQNAVDAKLNVGRQSLVGYVKANNITVFAADDAGNAITGKNWNASAFGENVSVVITGTYKPSLPSLLIW